MDNDRELLEMAAKAANNDARWSRAWGCMVIMDGEISDPWALPRWLPFADDADAHRLMVKLGMLVNVGEAEVMVAGGPDIMVSLTYGVSGKEETVRRAIVLAAAEVGKRM